MTDFRFLARALLLLITAVLLAGKASCATVNLVDASEDLRAPAWSAFVSQAEVAVAGVPDPDGGTGAFRVTLRDGGYFGQIIAGAVAGKTYLFSAWCRTVDGSSLQATLAWENNPPAPLARFVASAVSNQWTRISLAAECPAGGNANFRISFRNGDLLVWHPQVEEVAANDGRTPGAYTATGARTATSAARTGKPSGLISCWGDSLTEGAGGKPYPAILAEALPAGQRTVFNCGIGGQKSGQIAQRFHATSERFADTSVIWAGRNNYGETDAILADIEGMVDSLTTDHYLVLAILNMEGETAGGGALAAIDRLNRGLERRYPGHFLDIRRILVDAYDAKLPGDVSDHAADLPPRSLRSDAIHLNSAGYRLVAERVQAALRGMGAWPQ